MKMTKMQKSRKKTTAVTRPNFRKALRDKIPMKVRVTPELVKELYEICLEEKVEHWQKEPYNDFLDWQFLHICDTTNEYDFCFGITSETFENRKVKEYHPETDSLDEPKPDHITDTSKKVCEHLNGDVCMVCKECSEDCPANVMPKPIRFEDKVPKVLYMVTPKAFKEEKVVAFHHTKKPDGTESITVEFDYGGKHSLDNCYATAMEAFTVFMKGR